MDATSDNSRTRPKPPAGTTHFHHDWDDDRSLASAVVAAVADRAEVDPTELEVLYEVVDPDALNELFDPGRTGDRRDDGYLWFPLDDYAVTVYGDGFVVVRPLE